MFVFEWEYLVRLRFKGDGKGHGYEQGLWIQPAWISILTLPLAGYVTMGTSLKELDQTNSVWWLRLNKEFHKSLKCDQLLLNIPSDFLCKCSLSFVQGYPQSLGGRASFKLWFSRLMSKENPCIVFEARQPKFKPQQHNSLTQWV